MHRAHDKNGKLIYIDKTVEKIDISAYRDKFKQLKEQKMLQEVYDKYTGAIEFSGTQEECQDFIANYGNGWAALDVRSTMDVAIKAHIRSF